MIAIQYIRQNPSKIIASMDARGVSSAEVIINNILKLDEILRKEIFEIEQLQSEKNKINAQIPIEKKAGNDISTLLSRSKEISTEIATLSKNSDVKEQLQNALAELPNIISEDTPLGKSENDNIEISRSGEIPEYDFEIRNHVDIAGYNLNFGQTAEISGARFATLFNSLAKLERALVNFFLDELSQWNYIETSIPVIVKNSAMYGVGQLPKFAEDSFAIENSDFRLIPTGEVSLTNLVAGQIIPNQELPLRYCTASQCFRSEAGSAGKDTKGLIRMHQFQKVEIVTITSKELAQSEFDRKVKIVSSLLEFLELPYRIVSLCSGDIGFSANKTYDFEVWIPSQNQYREIASCSYFGNFQACRMNARYRNENRETEFLHTLNSSALPIGRTIVALLENHQQKDGSVKIPTKLRKFLQNTDYI